MNAHAPATVLPFESVLRDYDQMTVHFDRKRACAWCYMEAEPRACFSTKLLNSLLDWTERLKRNAHRLGIRYHVIASNVDGVFNLGGDLDLLRDLALAGDRDGLMRYGKEGIDALYANLTGFDQDVTTISLIQGEALGGGFETALSSDVIIAEKGSRMGFPEILFNLFPGMGAYSLLSRKLDPRRAEKLILSGKLYTAEELYDMGVVDILVDEDEGEMAVYDYIKRENRARNGFRAMRKVRDYCNPVTYKELADIVEIWVDTVLKLDKRDLRMMERLVSRQTKHGAEAA
jgi:DSF synthase